ncbi:hypothetical protein QE152_g19177 [Popillia japonica]|uniref:Uncharacterized protein n=1 Tax=Popillia japonica TaxID=7064 RepID=A0AAW1L4C5_POPJA
MKKSRNEEVEECNFMWFVQTRSLGQPKFGSLSCEKALFQVLKRVQVGWKKFKRRHGIRELEIQGERLYADLTSAESFIGVLRVFVEEEEYDKDFICI